VEDGEDNIEGRKRPGPEILAGSENVARSQRVSRERERPCRFCADNRLGNPETTPSLWQTRSPAMSAKKRGRSAVSVAEGNRRTRRRPIGSRNAS
jgi:hypothetical protein